MRRYHRIMTVLLVILFVSSLLFSAAFVAEHAGSSHCCSGSGCTVCAVLSLCGRVLRGILLLCAAVGCAVSADCSASGGVRDVSGVCVFETPVSLRVKLAD